LAAFFFAIVEITSSASQIDCSRGAMCVLTSSFSWLPSSSPWMGSPPFLLLLVG